MLIVLCALRIPIVCYSNLGVLPHFVMAIPFSQYIPLTLRVVTVESDRVCGISVSTSVQFEIGRATRADSTWSVRGGWPTFTRAVSMTAER